MSFRKFNIFSSIASAITPSYVASASSDGGLVPDGSNATDPSLDVFEDVDVCNAEMGNTDIKQVSGNVKKAIGPRYLYYRIYVKDGVIPSNNPIYSNDQSLSRILTKYVAPPHTITSLKRHLCKVEGFPKGAQSCSLFASLSDQKVMDEPAPVSLYGPSGPGLSEHDPVALVVGSDRGSGPVEPKDLPERPEARNPNYVYYRLYSPDGAIPSKMAFSESDNSLGRIGTLDIAPSYTVTSLKACLIKLERMASPSQLFSVVNSEAPMNDDDPLQFLTGTYPGSDGDDPMAFVVDSDTPTPSSPALKQVKSNRTCNFSIFDPSWLSIVQGEILTTNGIKISQIYKSNGISYEGYDATNSSGKKGFVQDERVEFC